MNTRRARGQPVLGRLPWVPIVLSVVVLFSSTATLLPIRDARTFGTVPEAQLTHSPAYTLVAPLSNVLDTLSLISRRQHIALLLGAVLLFVLWRGLVALIRKDAPR